MSLWVRRRLPTQTAVMFLFISQNSRYHRSVPCSYRVSKNQQVYCAPDDNSHKYCPFRWSHLSSVFLLSSLLKHKAQITHHQSAFFTSFIFRVSEVRVVLKVARSEMQSTAVRCTIPVLCNFFLPALSLGPARSLLMSFKSPSEQVF